MLMNQRASCNILRRIYYLAIFASLFGLAVFATACNSQPPPTADKGAPQPSPTDQKKPCIFSLGETPIVISGGSFQIDFNKKLFPDNRNAPNEFKLEGENLKAGFIYNNNGDGDKDDEINMGDLGNADYDIILWRSIGTPNPVEFLKVESRLRPSSVTIKFIVPVKDFERRKNEYSNQFFKRGDGYRLAKVTRRNLTTNSEESWDSNNGLGKNGKVGIELFGVKP